MWIEFGRIQLPPGHHPNDIEKEWGKLIVAMLEREKSLRPEVERYEKPRSANRLAQCDRIRFQRTCQLTFSFVADMKESPQSLRPFLLFSPCRALF